MDEDEAAQHGSTVFSWITAPLGGAVLGFLAASTWVCATPAGETSWRFGSLENPSTAAGPFQGALTCHVAWGFLGGPIAPYVVGGVAAVLVWFLVEGIRLARARRAP